MSLKTFHPAFATYRIDLILNLTAFELKQKLNTLFLSISQVVSRLDDSKKKKLEKEFVKVSDDESGSDDEDRASDQSDLVS